ncbi:MAG: sigma-70 family RNA polymerase sigma factor [Runella slithyformis]|nr:MAG: sigma-70 family RNA polymerase sigma factor [Runella slithyformis]TAG22119.1 MAG: sigma-70 family RNA polymerase sigma factor [Cytophagales bacterium]TAG41237.1 MAG: sigma-70 family RNA polymerase sigma factor [Cytophagia bacterium]TAF01008.1 MAG: sigma-70 family RNA polymerase sigma factor [Runella slithyformis]TAF24784.1 MAG: sigma-70 family RNA polymerase sigma factor [Runella slithyformis]
MTDEQAMLLVTEGNTDQAAILYERYKKSLLNFFVYRYVPYETARDLTQQVFWRLLRYRNTYKAGTVFKTWIYEIARNVWHDYTKQNPELTELSELTNVGDAFDETTDQNEQLHVALAQLPQTYREVLLMSRFQDMSYDEIGETLGLSVANVKVRVFRAMQQLRDIYFKLDKA